MPAYEIPGFTRSYEPAADLTASWFKFVKLAGSVVGGVTAANDPALGVRAMKRCPAPR